jgi:hypothetical protein
VVITVSSIPTRVGRTASTSSAAASTARMTVFQPTPKLLRIVSTGTFSAVIATAAHRAAFDYTDPGAIDGLRSTKMPHPSTQTSSRLCHTTLVARPPGHGQVADGVGSRVL